MTGDVLCRVEATRVPCLLRESYGQVVNGKRERVYYRFCRLSFWQFHRKVGAWV